ncbi:NAD-dependent epimerase/dehydratase family protein [Vibrio salinus]|uniref:NAD-dependent epimerase/dehydratase family protein n=1 Tax=Vibrio salinus TaxID=2899784 RepID=UPI001E553533|nr:NAD-dependent epimerase/dehydratase family protein [Vibrio salinus]MCE0496291.1 NAD-dependent epimerase/dehydratase family protein [Vibrio salinus]
MTVVTIIGAGWLGSSLATYLKSEYTVYASRTTPDGVSELRQKGINGFKFDFKSPEDSLETVFSQQTPDIVIGSFPPGFRKGHREEYTLYWQQLCQACQQAKISKIIMVSSTSVYPNCAEIMTEESASLLMTKQDPQFTDNAKILLTAENFVQKSGIHYCILRMSGLVGPGRNPARFINKMKQLSTLAPANIVHLIDAVKSIDFAIKNLNDEIVNVTTPYTVSKAEFYKYALSRSEYDYDLPEIVSVEDKCIVSDKLQNLGYSFHFSATSQAIDNINETP